MKTFIQAIEKPGNELVIRFKENDKYSYETIIFDNFFYITREDFIRNKDNFGFNKILNQFFKKAVEYNATNGDFIKLYLKNNDDRYYANSIIKKYNIKTFEADLTSKKRFVIDHTENYDFSNYSVLFYDLETDDRKPMEKDDRGGVITGDKQIMSIALEDKQGKQFFYINKNLDDPNADDEFNLLNYMCEVIKDYDLMTAWNGSLFDMLYLKQRMAFHIEKGRKFSYDIKFLNHIDELLKMKKYSAIKYEKYSLEAIAQEILSDGKIDFSDEVEAGRGRYYSLWKNNPKLLEEYNRKDVTLMRKIDEKVKMYDILFAVCNKTKCTPEDAMFISHTTDDGLVRLNHKHHYIVESKPNKFESEERKNIKIGGGYPYCKNPGFHKNVKLYDFKSEYPLTIMTFNISNETYVTNMMPSKEELIEVFGEEKTNILFIMDELKDNKKIISYLKTLNIEMTETDLEDLMFEFIDKYEGKKAQEYAKKHDLIFTPADINNDKNLAGTKHEWNFHPHRFFKKQKGFLPIYVENAVIARDESKYIFNEKNKNSSFYQSAEYYVMLNNDSALKVIANGAFGFTGLRSSRFFMFHIADTVTTCGRYTLKKTLIFTKKLGFMNICGATDSSYLKNLSYNGTTDDLDIAFFEYFDKMFKNFNLSFTFHVKNTPKFVNKKLNKPYKHMTDTVKRNYYCVFELEKTIPAFLSVVKNRYYYLEDDIVKTTGGEYQRSDTNPLAKILQKELVTDILLEKFNKQNWIDKISKYEKMCFDNKLDKEYLVFKKVYQRHYSTYGGPMIDKKTGKQKITKNGSLCFGSIPCQIKLIKRLNDNDDESIEIGDTINYIVGKKLQIDTSILREKSVRKKHGDELIDSLLLLKKDQGLKVFEDKLDELGIVYRKDIDKTQRGITESEYMDNNDEYDKEKYWDRISTPLITVLRAFDKKMCYTDFGHLW